MGFFILYISIRINSRFLFVYKKWEIKNFLKNIKILSGLKVKKYNDFVSKDTLRKSEAILFLYFSDYEEISSTYVGTFALDAGFCNGKRGGI